jgi:phage/plasmid primase-like uncharacterized protein
MAYMSFEEQIASHLEFLKSEGLDVDQLKIDGGFIRCQRELCYKTTQTVLKNGLIGLMTWCRCTRGETKTHKTYGSNENQTELFWRLSDPIGESDYLNSKSVGCYGIRFRSNTFGLVAVIPMYDLSGQLKSYQLLNPDNTKRFPKNARINGLLHMLRPFVNGQPYGLAESYVTAATCYELTGISTATVFSASNLLVTAKGLKNRFPLSHQIIFADNDRHLKENKGIQAAQEVKKEMKEACTLAIPDFSGYPAARQYTDWNDLLREKGYEQAKKMITDAIER